MRKGMEIHNRFLAAVLALMLIIAMIPINVISANAATESFPDSFTITVKDSNGKAVDGASVKYSVKVDGTEKLSDTVTADKGIAVINDMNTIDMSNSEAVVSLDAAISKIGYDEAKITDEIISEANGNIDVTLTDKETVTVSFAVKDSARGTLINDADVSITGYDSLEGNTVNGVFKTELYKDEAYSVEVTKKGFKPSRQTSLKFSENSELDILLEAKLVDNTFAFNEEAPADIVYGDSYANAAYCNESTGVITYSVESGKDVVSVDEQTGAITSLKAGTATIKARLAEDDNYQESEITYQITVVNADDSGFGFEKPAPSDIVYEKGAAYSNKASGGNSTGAVTYEIVSGHDVAEINEINKDTGVLTIKKAGTVEVKATKAADEKYKEQTASYTLKINKAKQEIKFDVLSPEDQLITNGTYTNEASGGSGTGNIKYSVTEGNEFAEIKDSSSPTVTFKKVGGPITVKAVKAEDDSYNGASVTYTFYIKKSAQADMEFNTTEPTTTYGSNNNTYENPLTVSGSGTGAVTYEIVSGYDVAEINKDTGVLTIKKAGTVEVQATRAGDDNYEEKSNSYILTINKAKQEGFKFNNGSEVTKTWSPENNTYTNQAVGGQSGGSVSYSIKEVTKMPYGGENCASLNEATGEVTMNGGGSVEIKAVKEGDDCYEPIEISYTLTINRAKQSDFSFSDVPDTFTYNNNGNEITLSAVGGSGDGEVTYSIKGGGEYASIDGNVLTVIKAGDQETAGERVAVSIGATKAETNTYDEATAVTTIYIAKAAQQIKFDDPTTKSIIYGNEFTNAAHEVKNTEVPDGKGHSDSEIVYSVDKGEDIVSVGDDGKLEFKNNKVGEIEIKAFKAGDDCYKNTSATYKLKVDFAPVPNTPYTLYGDKINESGWYSGDVTITPAEGYEISYSNDLTDNEWADKLIVTNEGYNGKTVYLKNATGITGAVEIPEDDIRIDKSTPKDLKINYTVSVLDTILEKVTFGFYKAPATVTVEAYDEISGVKSLECTYGENTVTFESENIEYSEDKKTASASFEIPAQFRGKVSFKAVDTAGNTAEKYDDKVIVVDNIAPGVTVSYDNNNVANGSYYNAERTATITIKESNFFKESFDKVENKNVDPAALIDEHLVISVTKIDDDGVSVTNVIRDEELTTPFAKSETEEDTWFATLLFDENADYSWSIEYKDFSGNTAGEFSDSFTIDKIKPEISVTYDNNEAVNTDHYNKDRIATFKVVEHNFRASNITVEAFSAKDVSGNDVDIAKDYQKLLREGEWTDNGNEHTLEIPFDVDARYSFRIVYSDLADNGQKASVEDEFCVDKLAPSSDSLKISYSTSVLDTILENITYGFYKAPITVTITADDITAGVDCFKYSYGVQDGASSVNVGKGDAVISEENIAYSQDGKTATATFEIPAQFRGCVSYEAVDKSGNVSEVFNDSKVVVVDDIAPGVTVSYDNNNASNDTYYNAERTATITIKESNFFKESFDKVENKNVDPASLIDEHLVVKVTKADDNGVSVTKVIRDEELTTPFAKSKTEEDTWVAKLLFDDDADYSWSIEYKDFSGNTAGEFTDSFTIDKIKPEISVTYDNNEAVNADHYNKDRTATVTITEHNFRPSDITVEAFSAKDVSNNDVDIAKDYQELLREGKWIDNGNEHTLDIPFDVDARYSFKIVYSDLADNGQKASVEDGFCVDKLAPSSDSLKISYSTSVLDTILKNVTFGFYSAPVKVTIEADDSISGVDYFTYSYRVSEGESDINKGVSDVVVNRKDIEYSEDKKHATASFEIPAQFRGKVSYTATDTAGNTSEIFEDGKVVVVDNIAPGVTVTYDNNSPYNKTYYNKSRTATIKIKEANFFKESFDKVENISADSSALIDEHLIISVTSVDNNGASVTNVIKSEDLTTPFTKAEDDNWVATLLFDDDADYSWSIEYKDFSGASAGRFEDAFTVDNTDPVIEVAHSNNDVQNGKYFKADRPVTISVTEHNFRAQDIVVKVTSEKAIGKVADYAKYLTNPANWKTNGNVHTADIVFDKEAYYTFDISYTDMANRKNQSVSYGQSASPKNFVIDKTAPTKADITINKSSILAKNGVAFEKFYKSGVEVKYTVNCDISGLNNITYQKVDSVSAYTENSGWKPFDGSVTVKPNEKFVIYFRAEDNAGNYSIVNSTGIVVDNKAPEGETYAPEIDIKPEKANENALYNSNVKVDLKVVDPKYRDGSQVSDGYYSGIKKITYKIYTKDTTASESGTLLDIDAGKTSGAKFDADKLINEWTGKITVSAKKFNSNKVIVEVYAIDNAGNARVTTNEMIDKPIGIDITAPSINVSYNDGNGNGDDAFADSHNGAYFKDNRIANITITERNFDQSRVEIKATKDGEEFEPALSNWKTAKGGGNGDATTHSASITYSSDGIYTFEISYTDNADNADNGTSYDGLSPERFTIDKTAPVFSVTYDNNSALNGNYYKAQRVATLTVIEHNFETSRVQASLTAADNGKTISAPAVSGWTSNGDTHTATITYSDDALYRFDFDYTDKAGNKTEDIEQQSFYVDKTKPKVSIEKIVDKSANNDEGNIGYVITATDTNFDVFTPVLTAIVRNGNTFEKKVIEAGSMSGIANGKAYTVTNLSDDGVYRISCTVVDKAGNAYSEVELSHKDGTTYSVNRSGKDTLLTFSVNREGSAFDLDENTVELLDRYYIQDVDKDVVIDEINADVLEERQVTLNGKKLDKSQYTVKHSSGTDSWEKYTYTISKALFEEEGEYNVVVSSKDKAANDAFSDVKDAGIKFVVDQTAPVVTVAGLADNGRYRTESQTVTAIPTDDGGELKSIVVTLLDQDGKAVKELLNLSDEAFENALKEGDGKVTFEIPEGLYQNVQIVCDDKAYYGKAENIKYDETFANVSVTPNAFLIFWANKPLRYVSIGAVVLLIAGIGALIFFKKRKKSAQTKE